MTIAWPMVTGACLTLASIHLRIAFGDTRRAPHAFFFLAAVAVAGISVLELAVLRTEDLEQCRSLLRWSAVPVAMMLIGVTGFAWSFGTGRPWLALLGMSLGTIAQLPSFFSAVPLVRNPVALRRVEGIGGVSYSVPQIAEGPWAVVEMAGVLLIIAFVTDASVALWKRGGRRRAAIVGGSIAFFFLSSRTQAFLVESGRVQTPYFTSFTFLAVLIAMGHELAGEVFRAARLSRDLLESERRMDLAARSAHLGFWTWDIARDEIWASDTARSLFDVPPSERVKIGRFVETLHPEDRDGVKRAIDAALSGSVDYESEYRVVLRDGGHRWIDARGRVEFDDRGKPVLMRGVLMDTTARRLSEYELQQLRGQLAHAGRVSTLGQLASALAHELNQPLGAILRNAEAAELLLQQATPDLEELRAILSDIRRDDQRAGEVIDRLRALLKHRKIESLPLPMADVINEVHALVRADAAARDVNLEVYAAPDLPPVKGDRVHLQQVLLNLIINAMDALADSPPGARRVQVSALRRNDAWVEVTVADTGRGIAPGGLDHVFEAFYTTKAGGLGMGLPISRTIIEAHGGRLVAENRPEGGAIFRFTLALADT